MQGLELYRNFGTMMCKFFDLYYFAAILSCSKKQKKTATLNGFHHKPPLCKGRWHFRKKMTEGLLLTSLSSFYSLPIISQSLSLAFARQLPLHKGAFDTIKFRPCFLFAFSSSAEPLLNHATIAWFSSYKKRTVAHKEV